MGTPLFAASVLFAPLQQLARWVARSFAGAPGRGDALAPPARAPRQVADLRQPVPVRAARPARLRVVRVFEGPHAAGAGRMVISGRMADVCAELERLAALETAAG